jgi:acyl carrier protein
MAAVFTKGMVSTVTETVANSAEVLDDRVVAGICAALESVLEAEVTDLGPGTRLADAGLDSTGVLELLMQLEEALGIEFDAENLEMSHFESVESLARFVSAEMAV